MQTRRKDAELTIPDLIILSFLVECPMHGYQLAIILKERQVKDWAGVSKPQVYYSLKKMEASGLIRGEYDEDSSLGPERRIFTIAPEARSALADALDSEKWATSRPASPFATWAMLSQNAKPSAVKSGLERRRDFLRSEIAREKQTLDHLSSGATDRTAKVAKSLVALTIKQFELELAWLEEFEGIAAGLSRR